MSRKKRHHSQKSSSRVPFHLHPDIKRSITIVLLFAFSAILFLSLFHVAGSLGEWINRLLSAFFGIDRYLVPVLFTIIGATYAFPERGRFSAWNYLGILFFFLSFNATLNLLMVENANPITTNLTLVGGYLGQFLATLLPPIVGYWGSLIIVMSLLFVSIMLTFNTSLRNMAGLHKHITGWFGERLHAPKELLDREEMLDLEEADTEVESLFLIDDVSDDQEDDLEPAPFRKSPLKEKRITETVLITKQNRKISIPLDLLDHSTSKAQSGDIEKNKEIIARTFHEFGIEVEMGEISVGPTVTQYTLRPSQGIKISRIVGLQNDLALALAAHPLRLEAPIPGKSLVGIEVPNTKVAIVTLRDVMENKLFTKGATGLSIPLGKDVSGQPWIIDLAKMPHLLVAGSTGSGKSVCLNTLIISLLYQNGPDELKLILIDPKRVELTMFAGIPHLLVPPIINTEDTINALKWTVREMDRRLDVLSKFGARNIDAYNERSEEKMPKIVVVIDELADLMTTSGREVESTIVRIAQMARAVGIHLVLATQRPSVDVITGLIKANVPGRIAFAVASQTDSRTILDLAGAEKLLGRGDMLFTCSDLSKPKRIQGAYASNEEIERVVAFLRQKGEPDYNHAITEITKAGTVFDSSDGSGDDPLFQEAVDCVIQADKASTSFLQRRLRVGYSRAARLIDLMEEAGIVGHGDGAKPREILVTEWPPDNHGKVGTPVAQDDYDEAQKDDRVDTQEPEIHQIEPVNWEDRVDDSWLEKEK